MRQVKTDIGIAVLLLVFCAIMLRASNDIEDLGFGGMTPDTWPRIILWALAAVTVLFLLRSGLALARTPEDGGADSPPAGPGWRRYVNAVWCFALFLGFLLTLDILGMLIGGILFTFLLLSVLGGITPRKIALHLFVAVVAIGTMWAVFVFGLGVVLPEGQFLQIR